MKFRDYYETLGVEREASQDEIKRAYRRLARKYHPDVSTESAAEERFKEMKEAYEVLKDPEKREAYDKFGENWQAGQDFEPPPTWEQDFAFEGGGFTDAHEFSDFFESLFGQRHGHRYRSASPHQEQYKSVRMAGEDIQARMSINVEDAFRGATKTINIEIPVIQGNGRPSSERRTLNVRIPKGITEGKRIRLEGQGGPGIGGGLAGDLYVEISFDPHRFYTVQARDVFVTLPITAWEAALGSKVTAPTLGGPVDLTIPAGITSQRKLRLKGRGFPGQPAGDQIVDVQIVVPNKMSQEVRELYEQLQKKEHFHPRQILGV